MNKNLLFLTCFALLPLVACGDDDADPPDAAVADRGKRDAAADDAGPAADGGADGGEAADCVKDPKTHVEIINACTDAEPVDKDPVLPLLLDDGSLPPLP